VKRVAEGAQTDGEPSAGVESRRKKSKKRKKERLGRVIHAVGDYLIVRCDRRINISRVMRSTVIAKGKKKVGKVHDVFGPVAQPYVSVRMSETGKRRIPKLLGNKLYFLRKIG